MRPLWCRAVQAPRYFSKAEAPSTTRCSHSASGRRTSLPSARTCHRGRETRLDSRQVQRNSFPGREGQRNSSNRANESAVLRSSYRRHVEGEGVVTSVESFSPAAHLVCSPQAPWNYQRDAREKSAGGPDEPSQRVLAPATTSSLSLRAPRSSAKRHHDGQANPRECQKQPVLSPKCSMTAPP